MELNWQYYVVAFVFAFMVTFLLARAALLLFPRWGLMDRPERYGLTRAPIPYYGGLLLYVTFVVGVLLFLPLNTHVVAVLVGATLLTGVSFLDDLFGLSPWLRLGVQALAALTLVGAGIGIQSLSNPLGGAVVLDAWTVAFPWGEVAVLSAVFTVVWVVIMTNTMNWLDGLNGLPSGVTVVASLTLFFLSVRPDLHFDPAAQVPVAVMSLLLCGAALAFWLFDFYPARILMGDTGSMFLGFLLAVLAIFSGGKVATALLVLGIPVLDAVWVVVRRILQKKSPMKGDLGHLHHRLLEVGFSHRQALVFFYVLSALFGGVALFFQGAGKLYALAALFVFLVGVGVFLVRRGKKSQ